MMAGLPRAVTTTFRGLGAAVRARPGATLAVLVAVFALHVFLPPLLLAITRKPWTYFTFNPWLAQLPHYLVSSAPLDQKIDFLSRVAVFWFSADGPYGFPEWGFAVDAMDLVRFLAMSLLVGAYFALVLHRREQGRLAGWRAGTSRAGGIVGAFAGVLGLSTGPCSVVGCGAPVLPVVGLVFAGLSSGTLALLSGASRVLSALVLLALTLVVAWLGWQAGSTSAAGASSARGVAAPSALTGRQSDPSRAQDLRDVFGKHVPPCGRMSPPRHCGHLGS